MKINNKSFQRIIPTNIRPAYYRAQTDIPYAQEIWQTLIKIKNISLDNLGSFIQAQPKYAERYKLIDEILNESGITQVIELASGWSTRGLSFCKSNCKAVYIEIDLPDVAKNKSDILKQMGEIPQNLHIFEGNALCEQDFTNASNYFNPNKPIAVITEGLLGYLTFKEKEQITRNVQKLLTKFKGIWITNGFKPSPNKTEELTQRYKFSKSITGRDRQINEFKDNEHIISFLAKFNMICDYHSFNGGEVKIVKINE